MGEVYLCLDLEGMEPIALKTFQQRFLTHQQVRKRFEQEAYTWVSLEKHPHIVRCYFLYAYDNQPFLHMEWVASEASRGTDLRTWLRRGALSPKQALQFAIDICRGLEYAHRKVPGLVHRDLKPENILVAQSGIAKITDFGLAKLVQEAGLLATESEAADVVPISRAADSAGSNRSGLTNIDGVVGTPPYMAPELWLGEALDARTDIYALGCILFELITGRFAFSCPAVEGIQGVRQAHLSGISSALMAATESSTLLSELREVVAWCLAREPKGRPASPSALLAALEELYERTHDAVWRRLPESEAFTSVDYTNRGYTYDHLGHREKALHDYSQAISLDPSEATAYSNRGSTYGHLGRYEEALHDLDLAVSLDPNSPEAFSNRGITYDHLGHYEKALHDYSQAISLDPSEAKHFSSRGHIYSILGRHQEALQDHNEAIALDSNSLIAYSNRGNTYQSLGRYEDALEDFNRALSISSKEAKAFYNRGTTLASLGRYEDALEDFNQALSLAPNYINALNNRGQTFRILGFFQEAIDDFNQAITLDPSGATVYANRGIVYREFDHYEEALGDFNEAIDLDPDNLSAHLNKGILLANSGRLAEALLCFERADQLVMPLAEQDIAQVQEMMKHVPMSEAASPPADAALFAEMFKAFGLADSLAEMHAAVREFPRMNEPPFVATMEKFTDNAPTKIRAELRERLDWLKQIARS